MKVKLKNMIDINNALRERLNALAKQLNTWAQSSGYSTQLVKPMHETAADIHRVLDTIPVITEYVYDNTDPRLKITWFDAEKQFPFAGQHIVFNDAVGMFSGVFHAQGSGVVHVAGNAIDKVQWENVYSWIPHPEEV